MLAKSYLQGILSASTFSAFESSKSEGPIGLTCSYSVELGQPLSNQGMNLWMSSPQSRPVAPEFWEAGRVQGAQKVEPSLPYGSHLNNGLHADFLTPVSLSLDSRLCFLGSTQ